MSERFGKSGRNLPGEDPVSFFLVVHEATDVLPTVAVCELTLPVHLIVNEITDVTTAIGPGVLALALHQILLELPLIARSIVHEEFTLAVAEPILVIAFELSVVPHFSTVAVLFVVEPLAIVAGSVNAH